MSGPRRSSRVTKNTAPAQASTGEAPAPAEKYRARAPPRSKNTAAALVQDEAPAASSSSSALAPPALPAVPDDAPSKPATKKRGRPAGSGTQPAAGTSGATGGIIAANGTAAEEETGPAKPKKKGRVKKVDPNAERNARVEVSGCPEKMFQKFKKAIGQRMFMIDREKIHPAQEDFKILGSTGNVYTTTISTQPKCNCPDYLFNGRTICKHTIFVLIRVLKVSDESDVWYRARLRPHEVAEIFANAPANPHDSVADPSVKKAWRIANGLEDAEAEAGVEAAGSEAKPAAQLAADVLAKRMQVVGEDCPVCYEEITQEEVEGDRLAFDESKNGCGKPLHKQCFEMWAQTAANQGNPLTCVWCRAPWPMADGVAGGSKGKGRVAGQTYASMGYLNMAAAAGMRPLASASTH